MSIGGRSAHAQNTDNWRPMLGYYRIFTPRSSSWLVSSPSSFFVCVSGRLLHIMSTVASSGAGVPVTTTPATAASAARISASASTSASSSVTPPTLATPAGTSLLTLELQDQIQTMVQAAIAAALPTTSASLPTTGPPRQVSINSYIYSPTVVV